ncbi:sulfatase-like hydrolase/transferase [Paenibacillus sp.]|uniref:sulfatase-like hydrolase/transferase n=1 Tax=Paenibacillus sp. TaxID=58172 RepID=UPI002D291BCE|nr:sulfatase-like hydrolase/transferase [Paenibacillus sp.]HZG84043.1 sulfatase-like hydrolase/transferase [Paenibacillus sp.]
MRPNIVIINPDQMRADALGHLGNRASRTPFLDRLARTDAVSFRNAFCQNPVCVPSRCSFLTGLYPHVNGHRTMLHMLHSHETSLFKELKDAGYYVWMNARNDFLAAQEETLFEQHATEIFYGGNIAPPPGPKENVRGAPGSKHFYSFYVGELQVDEQGRNHTFDDEAVNKSIEFLQNYSQDEPFCLFLGLEKPHPPYKIEAPYFHAINRQKLPERIQLSEEELAKKPKALKELIKEMNTDLLDEKDWDELRACYLGMCMKVDEYVQSICEALKEKGIYDNTAIFIFSDHGDYTGDYNLVEKAQNTFEDCLVNVPLLIKPPKGYPLDAGVSDSLVELVDFYATTMDMCGVTPTHSHFGKSLVPILENRSREIREFVYCEGGRLAEEAHCSESRGRAPHPFSIYYPRMKVQQDDVAHTKATMIRSDKFKYILRKYEMDEFYDLKKDPQEKNNEIDNPEYRNEIMEMKQAMLEWYQTTCDIVPFTPDRRDSYAMTWNRIKVYCPKELEDEVKEKIHGGMGYYPLMEWLSQRKSR